MNCENCPQGHGGTIAPTPRIKVVQGNMLRLAIPLTLRTIMKDGDDIEYQDTDFIPSSEHPVLVVFNKGKNNFPAIATMDGNVAVVEEHGKLPIGVYDITIECRNDVGEPYRFKSERVVQVVDTTAEAGIEQTIEYEAQTWYLDSAIYLATTEIGSLSEEIDQRISDLFGETEFDANNKVIRFYNKDGSKVLVTVDATPFIADGMVENVYIDVERQVLVVVLNADAGSRMFTVPLYLIFANYYKKSEVDARIAAAVEDIDIDIDTSDFMTKSTYTYPVDQLNPTLGGKIQHWAIPQQAVEFIEGIGEAHISTTGTIFAANGNVYMAKHSGNQLLYSAEGKVVYNKDDSHLYTWTGSAWLQVGGSSSGGEGTVTAVKMNGGTPIEPDEDGVVDLGTVITAHQDISGKANSADLATVATSGSYNDLTNKPTIPAAVTVDSSLTGSSQTNPVQGGAIYSALETAKSLIVTISSDGNGGYTADKTYAEILAAWQSGRNVIGFNSDDMTCYQLSYIDSEIYFSTLQADEEKFTAFGIDSDDIVSVFQTISLTSSYVPQTRTVNNKALSSDITLTASDVGAQSTISDLATIRSGASAGATAVQPAAMNTALAGKQDTLTFDNAPTANSNNPVKSSGIKDAIDAKLSQVTVNAIPAGSVAIIDDLETGGSENALSASQGKVLNKRIEGIEVEVIDTEDTGFFVVDENDNVGMKYDEDGFDVALLSQHFLSLLQQAGIGAPDIETMQVRQEGLFIVDDNLNIAFSVTPEGINAAGIGEQLDALISKTYAGQCVVRFLPFLSAWNNASKNSLCLCSAKQPIVDNKVPFYEGFLFHKLPTDDKSLWYGTTLDNAVQIGTLSIYPKDYQFAMSPKDGRVIAVMRGNGGSRSNIHVWDGTTDHSVAAVSSDGNSRKPVGWLYNTGYDFIKNGNTEYCLFAEYYGDAVNRNGFYVWKGTYPYTSASDWKTVMWKDVAGKTIGTIAYGNITHFHFLKRDPWTNILYLAAGDYPKQLIWWYSTDYGETWTELTNNETNGWEQHIARTCNMVFAEDYIYWANDHGVNHCLNRIKRNAQTGIIDPSTREKLCDLRFGQACNSICYVESPHGLFMYERIDTGDEFSQQYGTPVKMYFWDIDQGKLYEVANVPLLPGQTWGGSRGKCYLHYTSGQQPRPAMGFSDDTRCIFDIAGSDGQNIGTIFYEL